ncbi:hypothetical protein [Nonomuraea sp. NPDC049695]|uniref:hypothetical protein n=1 Tax=Nonomuraea sp. NPDC049695 TaxID=3154734 RepID=UPI00342D1386
MNFCLSDLVPPLRWSDASTITLLTGQPDLPDAWWRSVPMTHVLTAIGPEALGELLTEIALEHWPAAAVGDVLPALHVLDPEEADEPAVAIALDRAGSWAGLLALTSRELVDQPFIKARPVLNTLFSAVLVRLAHPQVAPPPHPAPVAAAHEAAIEPAHAAAPEPAHAVEAPSPVAVEPAHAAEEPEPAAHEATSEPVEEPDPVLRFAAAGSVIDEPEPAAHFHSAGSVIDEPEPVATVDEEEAAAEHADAASEPADEEVAASHEGAPDTDETGEGGPGEEEPAESHEPVDEAEPVGEGDPVLDADAEPVSDEAPEPEPQPVLDAAEEPAPEPAAEEAAALEAESAAEEPEPAQEHEPVSAQEHEPVSAQEHEPVSAHENGAAPVQGLPELIEAAFAGLDDKSWAVAQNRVFTDEPSAVDQLAKLFAVPPAEISATEDEFRDRLDHWLASDEAAPYRAYLDELRKTLGPAVRKEQLIGAADWHNVEIRALEVPAWQFVLATLTPQREARPEPQLQPQSAFGSVEMPPSPPGPPQFQAFNPAVPHAEESNGEGEHKPYQPLKDVSQTRRCFRQPDGRWWLRIDVTAEQLGGGECTLPTGFASYLGLSPGESRTVRSAAGELTMTWHGRPVLESIERLLVDVGAREGGHLFLTLSDEGVLRARHLPVAAQGAEKITKALRLVGYTAPGGTRDQAARVIATRIGMTGPVALPDLLTRLRERGDRDLLELLD